MNTNDRPTRILMVCTGNICRSTMAHAVLEQAAARAGVDVIVDSAGVSDEEQGNPIAAAPLACCATPGTPCPTIVRARSAPASWGSGTSSWP